MTSSRRDGELIGLVLAGGKSERMGQAKAHLDFGRGPHWQTARASLSRRCTSIYFSVSPQLNPQLPVNEECLIRDVFRKPIGPLGGILSAFKMFSNNAIFVVACDLPFFDEESVEFLVKERDAKKLGTAFVSGDRVEALSAIYEPAIFSHLAEAWARDVYCPRKILENLDVKRVSPANVQWLTNINHKHEYETLAEPLRKTIKVHYYAQLREEARMSFEMTSTTAVTMRDLFLELKSRYAFTINHDALRYALNDRIVGPDEILSSNDEVVFLPPVCGG